MVGKFELASVTLDIATLEVATNEVIEAANQTDEVLGVHLCNVYTLSLASSHPEFSATFSSAWRNYIDGTPVSWVVGLATKVPTVAVRGPSLMTAVLKLSQDEPTVKHFFLGGSETGITQLVTEVRQSYPNISIAGYYSPPFAPLLAQTMDHWARLIGESGANVIWIGLGTPKQDQLIHYLSQQNGPPGVYLAVGAAFDFLAGTKPDAPRAFQGSGLEWAYRLATEPRRLWKRYLIDSRHLIRPALRAILSRRHTA